MYIDTGKIIDGDKVFDDKFSKDQPYSFTLGQGEEIECWDKGFL